jgi:hypothetical protein
MNFLRSFLLVRKNMETSGRASAWAEGPRRTLGADVPIARATLLKHVERIETHADGDHYIAKGNWSLLENRRRYLRNGAGGPASTVLPQITFGVRLSDEVDR